VDDIAISWLKSITDINVDTWLGVLGGATAIGGIAQGFLPKERLSGYTIIIIATIAGLLFSSIVIYRHREHEERIHFLARTFVQKLGNDRISFLQIGRIVADYNPTSNEIHEMINELMNKGTLMTRETAAHDPTFGKDLPLNVYFTAQ
jgi:hypothetical protein